MVIDAQATPVMAQDVIRHIRSVTDKPIKYVMLTHYHAVRVLGASGYQPQQIIASRDTYDLIVERGEQDMKSEIERFPRLFQAVESVPGLTWPTIVFDRPHDALAGQAAGRDHATRPRPHQGRHGRLAAAGARSCSRATWSSTTPRPTPAMPISPTGRHARRHRGAAAAEARAGPRRGAAVGRGREVGTRWHACVRDVDVRVASRRARAPGSDLRAVYRETYDALKPQFGHWVIFDHCLPFDVSRAYDEATGHVHPRIWTAQRDKDMWQSLEG